MVQSTPQTMKKLTRIKLVNWHYFGNETIYVNGSFLLSGENASGKSTILDAIQLILTTNTRRFNPAEYFSSLSFALLYISSRLVTVTAKRIEGYIIILVSGLDISASSLPIK